MTLTNTQKKTVKTKSGMTLIELTVVILVLLSLISILFVGARAWKRGSDRAGCIMNIRNVQQGMRSLQNMNGFNPGDTPADVTALPGSPATLKEAIVGNEKFVETEPTCPGDSALYTGYGTQFPPVGTLYVGCANLSVSQGHIPSRYTDW